MSEYRANISKLRVDNSELFKGRDLTDRQVVEELYELGKKQIWKPEDVPSLTQFAKNNGVEKALRTKRSFTESLPGFAQLFGQGVSSGFGDELAGYYAPTIQTALAAGGFVSDAASGVELEEAYENAKASLRGDLDKEVTGTARREAAETYEDHPVTAFGSELAGGIAQSALGGAALRGLGTVPTPVMSSMAAPIAAQRGARIGAAARQIPGAQIGANVGRMAGQLGINSVNAGTHFGQVAARAPSTVQAVSQYLGRNALAPQSIRGAMQGAVHGAGNTDGSGDMASNMLIGAGIGGAVPSVFKGVGAVAKKLPSAMLIRNVPRLAAALASSTPKSFHRNFAIFDFLHKSAIRYLGQAADDDAVRAYVRKVQGITKSNLSNAEKRAKLNDLGIPDAERDYALRNSSVINMEIVEDAFEEAFKKAPKAPARPSNPLSPNPAAMLDDAATQAERRADLNPQQMAALRGAPARPSAPPATPRVQSRKPPPSPHTGPVKQDPFYVALLGPLSKVRAGQRIGISMLQRSFRIGYDRAERILKQLELDGLVSAAQGPKGVRTTLSKPQSPLSRTFGQAPVSQLSRAFGTPSAAKAVPDAVVQPAARAAARSAPPSIANSPLVQRFGADPASNLSRRFGADSLTPPAQLQRAGLPSAMGAPRSALGADVSASYAQGMLPRMLQNTRPIRKIADSLLAVRNELGKTPPANVRASLMRTEDKLVSELSDAQKGFKNKLAWIVGDSDAAQRMVREGRFELRANGQIVDLASNRYVSHQKLRDLGKKYAAENTRPIRKIADSLLAVRNELGKTPPANVRASLMRTEDKLVSELSDGGVLSQDSLLSFLDAKQLKAFVQDLDPDEALAAVLKAKRIGGDETDYVVEQLVRGGKYKVNSKGRVVRTDDNTFVKNADLLQEADILADQAKLAKKDAAIATLESEIKSGNAKLAAARVNADQRAARARKVQEDAGKRRDAQRIKDAKKAERERKAAEREAERERKAAERAAKQERDEAERAAKQERKEAEKAAEEAKRSDMKVKKAIKSLRKNRVLPTPENLEEELSDKFPLSTSEIAKTRAYQKMRKKLDPMFQDAADRVQSPPKIKHAKLRSLARGLGVARDDAAILLAENLYSKGEPDAPAPAPAKARAAASTQGRPATPAMRKFIKNGFDKLFNPQTGDKPGKFGAGVVATALNKQSADKNDLVSLNYQQLPTFSSPQAKRLFSKLKVASRADRQAVLDADKKDSRFREVRDVLPDLHKNAFGGNFTERMRDAIEHAERETGVPASLLLGLLRKESAYGHNAISNYERKTRNHAGRGAFQFIGRTALGQAKANPADRDKMARALLGPNASRLNATQKALLLRYTPEWGALHAARLIKTNADVLETDNAALVAAAYNAGANSIKSKIRGGK